MRALLAVFIQLLFLNFAYGETASLPINPKTLTQKINPILSELNVSDRLQLIECKTASDPRDVSDSCIYQLGDYIYASVLIPKGNERPNIFFLMCGAKEKSSITKCFNTWLAAMIVATPNATRDQLKADWNSLLSSIGNETKKISAYGLEYSMMTVVGRPQIWIQAKSN